MGIHGLLIQLSQSNWTGVSKLMLSFELDQLHQSMPFLSEQIFQLLLSIRIFVTLFNLIQIMSSDSHVSLSDCSFFNSFASSRLIPCIFTNSHYHSMRAPSTVPRLLRARLCPYLFEYPTLTDFSKSDTGINCRCKLILNTTGSAPVNSTRSIQKFEKN